MKYTVVDIFQNTLKWLPICYCIKHFEVTKYVAICYRVIWISWFVHRNSISINFQPDATLCRYLFTTKSLYMFRVSQHPSSGVLTTVTASSNTGHVTGVCDSHKPVPIRPRWREVAVPVLWTVPEGAVIVFSTLDDGCCDTRNMWSDFAVNKYLHTVATGGIFINI